MNLPVFSKNYLRKKNVGNRSNNQKHLTIEIVQKDKQAIILHTIQLFVEEYSLARQ